MLNQGDAGFGHMVGQIRDIRFWFTPNIKECKEDVPSVSSVWASPCLIDVAYHKLSTGTARRRRVYNKMYFYIALRQLCSCEYRDYYTSGCRIPFILQVVGRYVIRYDRSTRL